MNKTEQDIIYLAGCAIHQVKPEVKGMNLEEIAKVASRHTISSMICMALESAGVKVDTLIDQKNKAIRKSMLMNNERQLIFSKLDEAGVWHLPLKGVLLEKMYPIYGMRQMADNDVLFDYRFREKVRDIFLSFEYDIESYNNGNHDVYHKAPIYNYEMHSSLFGKTMPVFYDYYTRLEEKYLWDDKTKTYARHMDVNDAYVYIVAHAYKHFSMCGTGIRTLMDLYMYNEHCKNEMDREYIRKQCAILGIKQYEKNARTIAYKLFYQPFNDCSILSQEEKEYVKYYFSSNTYGTKKQMIWNSVHKIELEGNKHAGIRYLCRRLVPSISWFRQNYHFLDEYPILIPFYAIFRIITKVFSSWACWTMEVKEVFLLLRK